MQTDKLNLGVQVATFLSVILGLGLVVWELRQAETLTRLQLFTDATAMNITSDVAMLGENPIEAEFKACVDPASLTQQEILLLEIYYLSHLQRVMRLVAIEDIGGLGTNWQAAALFNYSPILRTPFGRMWWENTARTLMGPNQSPVLEAGDLLLAGLKSQAEHPFSDCRKHLAKLAGLAGKITDE